MAERELADVGGLRLGNDPNLRDGFPSSPTARGLQVLFDRRDVREGEIEVCPVEVDEPGITHNVELLGVCHTERTLSLRTPWGQQGRRSCHVPLMWFRGQESNLRARGSRPRYPCQQSNP